MQGPSAGCYTSASAPPVAARRNGAQRQHTCMHIDAHVLHQWQQHKVRTCRHQHTCTSARHGSSHGSRTIVLDGEAGSARVCLHTHETRTATRLKCSLCTLCAIAGHRRRTWQSRRSLMPVFFSSSASCLSIFVTWPLVRKRSRSMTLVCVEGSSSGLFTPSGLAEAGKEGSTAAAPTTVASAPRRDMDA